MDRPPAGREDPDEKVIRGVLYSGLCACTVSAVVLSAGPDPLGPDLAMAFAVTAVWLAIVSFIVDAQDAFFRRR